VGAYSKEAKKLFGIVPISISSPSYCIASIAAPRCLAPSPLASQNTPFHFLHASWCLRNKISPYLTCPNALTAFHLPACFQSESILGTRNFMRPSTLEQTMHLTWLTWPSQLGMDLVQGRRATQLSCQWWLCYIVVPSNAAQHYALVMQRPDPKSPPLKSPLWPRSTCSLRTVEALPSSPSSRALHQGSCNQSLTMGQAGRQCSRQRWPRHWSQRKL
jgi:hypothetical protein